MPSGWWVGSGSKCSAVACQPGDWDAQDFNDATCDNGCLFHATDLCPSNMACVDGGNGTGVCVDACVDDNDCSGDHPYCVYADAAKIAKLCNKTNCNPCHYDSNPNNQGCDGTFPDGSSGDCGSASTCFGGHCISQCTSNGDCAAGKTCEYANASRTLKYCNTADCSSCEYDTYPIDAVCSNNLASGTYCGPGDECNGSGQCVCTLSVNGHSCDFDSDCCSSHCEAMNTSGTLRQCNRISCPAGQWDLDPSDLTCDNFHF